ncbi:MAG: hypothetical protein ACRDRP_08590 [Pseudonocardiaceae bacterium]
MRRGEIRSYESVIPRPGISRFRLIVSADTLNEAEDRELVLGVHIVDHDPESLLAPHVGDFGWAVVTTIERVVRSRISEVVGIATPSEMEQISLALRIALDLG